MRKQHVSKTTHYRRIRQARALGVPADQLPDGRGGRREETCGANHHRWNDGALKRSNGYRLVRVGESHPMADPNGYALEHRLVMATALGRHLASSEIVHHINGVRDDNRLENLELVTASEHSAIHNALRMRDCSGRFTHELPAALAEAVAP
jgi:HNH endonuclease